MDQTIADVDTSHLESLLESLETRTTERDVVAAELARRATGDDLEHTQGYAAYLSAATGDRYVAAHNDHPAVYGNAKFHVVRVA